MFLLHFLLSLTLIYASICPPRFVFNLLTSECDDVNECDTGPCQLNEDCINLPGRYRIVSGDARINIVLVIYAKRLLCRVPLQ